MSAVQSSRESRLLAQKVKLCRRFEGPGRRCRLQRFVACSRAVSSVSSAAPSCCNAASTSAWQGRVWRSHAYAQRTMPTESRRVVVDRRVHRPRRRGRHWRRDAPRPGPRCLFETPPQHLPHLVPCVGAEVLERPRCSRQPCPGCRQLRLVLEAQPAPTRSPHSCARSRATLKAAPHPGRPKPDAEAVAGRPDA
jgi:hypothetical protein